MESHARHFDLEAEKGRVFLFLKQTEGYALMRDELREALMNTPIEVFGEVIEPIYLANLLSRQVEGDERGPMDLVNEMVQKVLRIRHICEWCYKSQEKEVGGRNGGEERTVCSNPECISQRFMR